MIATSGFFLVLTLIFISRTLSTIVGQWTFCIQKSVESPIRQVLGRVIWRFLSILVVFLAATGFGAVIAHSNHVRDESISAIDDLFEFGTAVFNNSLFALILLVMAITIPKRIVRVIAKSSLKMSFVELDNKTLDKVDPMTSSLSAFFAFMTVAIAYSMRWELSTATELYQIASMFAFVLFYTLVCAGFEGYFYSREYKYGCSQSSANMAISHVASLGFLVFAFVHIFDLLLLLEQSGMVEALVLEHKQR